MKSSPDLSARPQAGGDTISSISVGEESQLLPGQQEKKERRVHGRCPTVCPGQAAASSQPPALAGLGPRRGQRRWPGVPLLGARPAVDVQGAVPAIGTLWDKCVFKTTLPEGGLMAQFC